MPSQFGWSVRLLGVAICALVAGSSRLMVAQSGVTTASGVYTDAQATRGMALYDGLCSACHGPSLTGSSAPPLAGASFVAIWDKQPLADLVAKIQNTMPANEPGSLTRAQATDLVAHLLKVNGAPVGGSELAPDDTLNRITLAAPAAPAGSSDPVPASAAAASAASRPLGNLAQVMRGIFFPSSNLLFNVQTNDPGVSTPPGVSSDAPFSWVDWGAGIYSGWEIADYAAIALADAAPLMLAPGRRCENGRPVPVENEDWVRFTAELVEAGRAAYKATQSRDQEAVSEVTNQIADACLHCHEVYRDKPGGAGLDPSNKAARCVP